jgi:hypothetical protein
MDGAAALPISVIATIMLTMNMAGPLVIRVPDMKASRDDPDLVTAPRIDTMTARPNIAMAAHVVRLERLVPTDQASNPTATATSVIHYHATLRVDLEL